MNDPYAVLGIADDADDAAIRSRYLELIRRFPPDHHPEKFTAIREAYESLKDLDTRLKHRLFGAGKTESIDAIIEEVQCRSSRRRFSLQTLLANAPKK